MHVFALHHITKIYGLTTVVNNISLMLQPQDRIGLVGANGVGKSTLIKIAAGEIQPDAGEVELAQDMKLGWLPQTLHVEDHFTLHDLIENALYEFRTLERQMRAYEQQMATASGETLDAVMTAYGDLLETFERRGGYALDARLQIIFAGMNISHLNHERAFATFSGGEKQRVGLALLLLSAPDVLLLDEPTNHLDHATLAWLENYLQDFRGAALIVSHDRQFLNHAVNVIVEIDEHTRQAKRYQGNYDVYATARANERRQWERDYERQQEEIHALQHEIKVGARRNNNYRAHTDNDKFVIHIKRQTHDATVSKRIRLAEEKLARLQENALPEPPDPLRFRPELDPKALKSTPLILSQIHKAYDDRVILNRVSLTVDAQSRILFVGPNGAGKSTLLKIITGDMKPDAGEVMLHPLVKIGYLAQEAIGFDPDLTLFEAYRNGLPEADQALKATLIKSGLFRFTDFEIKVRHLSSGQIRKLQIARLIAGQANLLILDEPTNDVSFDVLEGLETAIREFQGAVIASSHDRRFMQNFGGEVYEVADGEVRHSLQTIGITSV